MDGSRLNWPVCSPAIRDSHRVARSGAARLSKEHASTAIRLTVNSEDGVEGAEAGSERFLLEVGRGREAQAAFERGTCDCLAVCQQIEIHPCATVRMQKRKRGYNGEKKILDACRSLGHRPVGEMVAAWFGSSGN